MNIDEFFQEVFDNPAKYTQDFDFDTETKIAIHRYINTQLTNAKLTDIRGELIMAFLVGYQLKVFLDKKALEKLENM